MNFRVLYQDQDLIAITKPAGLLVHRTALDPRETQAALQLLRDQIGQKVFPVHRLDRPTSGVLIFALSSEMSRSLAEQFSDRCVKKTYLAVVRGCLRDNLIQVNHALYEELDELADGKARSNKDPQEAETEIHLLGSAEINERVDKYPTSRYSLVKALPKTGRKHQVRRHLRHIGHPIIGDVNHGSGKHNRFFAQRFGFKRLLLSCVEMEISHPRTREKLIIRSPLDNEFLQVLAGLGWDKHVAH